MFSVHRLAPDGATVLACAQAGCQACVERLLRQHAGLVHWVIRRECCSALPYGELLHEGQIALWQAIRHYGPRAAAWPSRPTPCPSSATGCVAPGGPGTAAAGQVARRRVPIPAELAAQAWQHQAVRAALREALAYLPERSYHILVAAYGLDGQPPLSLAAPAAAMASAATHPPAPQ